ncbi:MAG: hypothetical protein JOZ55_07570 [Alphaproteobacteria bacterium]|nr:hypothetical protein [Alphaproteobacteria bacterium]
MTPAREAGAARSFSDASSGQAPKGPIGAAVTLLRRYGPSAFGPLSVSAAHFLVTLALLRVLSATEFGQFSFALVLSGLCLGLTNGLLGAPLASIAHASAATRQAELNTYLKSCAVLAIVLGLATLATMLATGAPAGAALLFGVYGAGMSLRLFARTYAYSKRDVRGVVRSDCFYAGFLIAGLSLWLGLGHVRLVATAGLLTGASIAALFPFGRAFQAELVEAFRSGSLRAYRSVWRDLTRWSVLGVVTTEMTINAHAYLVTFISGPRAFALIAVGALFLRPFSLVVSALPDQERPAMATSIAGGDTRRALRIARDYRMVLGAVWLATIALSAIVLWRFPGLIVKKGYDLHDVAIVVVLWFLIGAVRGIRAPDGVLLQAARAFRPLADASVKSSAVSLIATLALLLAFGPIASLVGILIGDAVMLVEIVSGVKKWKAMAEPVPAPSGA